MTNSRGNRAANQFIIFDSEFNIFQSYDSVIVKISLSGHVELDEKYWNCSTTTSKYRNLFLGEKTKETLSKIKSGEYTLTDLNT